MAIIILLAVKDWSTPQIGTYEDDAEYIALAQSIVHGPSYGLWYVPHPPDNPHFPIGLPLLLAPLVYWFPGNFDLLRVVALGATLLNVSILFWGWRTFAPNLPRWLGLGTAALVGLSPITVLFSHSVLSEPAFLTFCLAAIYLTERRVQQPLRAWSVWFGLAVFGLVFVRTVGLLLLVALLAYLLYKRGRDVLRELLIAALLNLALLGVIVAVTPIKPINLLPIRYATNFAGYASGETRLPSQRAKPYVQVLGEGILLHLNVGDYLPGSLENTYNNFFDRSGVPLLEIVPGLLLLALLTLGGIRWFRLMGLSAFGVVVPPYVAGLIFWTWRGPRLLYPIQPQLILAMLLGVSVLITWLAGKLNGARRDERRFANGKPGLMGNHSTVLWRPALPWRKLPLLAILVGVLSIAFVLIDARLASSFHATPDWRERTAWIRANAPADAIILSLDPPVDYIYSGHTFLDPDSSTTSGQLAEFLQKYGIDYLIAPTADAPPLLVQQRTKAAARYGGLVQSLAEQQVINKVWNWAEGDVGVYAVDHSVLATIAPPAPASP